MTGTDGPYRENGESEQVTVTFQVVPCDLATHVLANAHIHTCIHHQQDSCKLTSLLFLQSTKYYWAEHEELGQNETGWGREIGREDEGGGGYADGSSL